MRIGVKSNSIKEKTLGQFSVQCVFSNALFQNNNNKKQPFHVGSNVPNEQRENVHFDVRRRIWSIVA